MAGLGEGGALRGRVAEASHDFIKDPGTAGKEQSEPSTQHPALSTAALAPSPSLQDPQTSLDCPISVRDSGAG